MGAEAAHQPLRQHRQQRVGKVEGVHPHVEQPRHGFGRAVGVQRREHEVAGQRGLDRRLRGFLVADLADHDHVGIGAHEGPQGLGEGPVDAGIDLHLPQARLRDLDRVFGGPDLSLRRVDVHERRMQGRGLARTRRADAEHHAVGTLDRAP